MSGYISAELDKDIVKVWTREDGYRITREHPAIFEFYATHPNGKYKSMFGDRLQRYQYKNYRDLQREARSFRDDGIQTFESDVSPAIKVLSTHYYGSTPCQMNCTFLDIEVDVDERGIATAANPYAPINAIAIWHQWLDQAIVFAVPPPEFGDQEIDPEMYELCDLRIFANERDLLRAFMDEIHDSDLLCGWNAQSFDFPYIAKRLMLTLGQHFFDKLSFEDARPPSFRESFGRFGKTEETLQVNGRLLADYMLLYKKFEFGDRESYKLDSIAAEHLPDMRKIEFKGSFRDLYHHNFNTFLRYNLRDTEILKGFEEVLGYVSLAILMYTDSTGLMQHVTGTVRLADYAIYNYCHHVLDVHVPDINDNANVMFKLRGADVLDTVVGMHDWVMSVDVSSLYPSSIRSVNISPEKLVGQFTEMDQAVELIKSGSDREITLLDDITGDALPAPASVWKAFLDENGFTISGYGTVFRNDSPGVIPTILGEWYNNRSQMNKRIEAIDTEIMDITSAYEEL